jgi:thioredoxin 2
MTQVVCTSCGAINRLPPERDPLKGRCGSCRKPLFRGEPAAVDAAMFTKQVAQSGPPVIVDVWAPWCGPCLAMAPEFARAAKALEPRARFLKLDSDQEPELSARLGIRSIPATILFKGGQEIARVSGAMTGSRIMNWVSTRL